MKENPDCNIGKTASYTWLFFVLIVGFIAMGLVSYFVNSPVYFVILLAALPVFPIAYVLIWRVPKIEAIKALCIVLAIEGIPSLTLTGYLIVPLAIVYLANKKYTNGKTGVAIACLVIGIAYVIVSFFKT